MTARPDGPVPAPPQPGIRLFSSAADARRQRRPNDILLLGVTTTALVLVLGFHSSHPGPWDVSLTGTVTDAAPGILGPVWDAARVALACWPLVLVGICLTSHGRMPLVRDAAVAALLTLVLARLASMVVDVPWPGPGLLRPSGSADYPLVAMALATSVVVAISPHLGRPMRRLSLAVLVLGGLGSVGVVAARPSGALAGVLVGVVAGRAVLVVFGSPGGLPTASQIRDSLRDLGVEVEGVSADDEQVAGTYLVHATDDRGPVDVVVCGRDARDAAVASTIWRQVWYRPAGRRATSSRLHQVEQEAFVTLLARGAGVEVPMVVTAGMARTGDAVLVTRPTGRALTADPGQVDLAGCWALLASLHDAGIVHGSIDQTTIGVTDGGTPCLVRMAGASTAVSVLAHRTDEVQMLCTTAERAGVEPAVAAARTALGVDGLADLLAYLQPALLSRRARTTGRDDLIDDLVASVTEVTGEASPDLVQLRRVTWGTVLQAGLLVLAGYALVVGLGSLDLAAVAEDLRNASVGLLLVALVVAQLPRPLQAVSTQGASTADLPLGPLAALQLAISYVNLAVPSAAGRLAVTIRFFQKVGVDKVTAVSIGGIDSAAGFIVQILIMVAIGATGASDVSLGVLGADVDISSLILVIAVVALAVVAIALALLPRLRAWLRAQLAPAMASLQVLRRPKKVVQMVAGNLASQLLFAAALALCVEAMGASVSYVDALMANTLVSLFAGLLPVPGGIGVSEAGLTAALSAAGVPQETALAAVIIYRVWSFYLPPVWGFAAMRWLQKRSYL